MKYIFNINVEQIFHWGFGSVFIHRNLWGESKVHPFPEKNTRLDTSGTENGRMNVGGWKQVRRHVMPRVKLCIASSTDGPVSSLFLRVYVF